MPGLDGLVEAVPNLSEGRRPAVVTALAAALASTRGVHLLDVSSDPDHNRSVFTVVGRPEALEEAALCLFRAAVEAIDLRQHRGEHPRFGAVDVLPFVPLGEVTMEACVGLARRVGAAVARELALPVLLYGEAATSDARRNLAAVRRGGFAGLTEKLLQPEWRPDFGPPHPHPSAGAAAVGARRPLIAFNVVLDSDRLLLADSIARTVRQSGGGLPAVRALGIDLASEGRVQVSMNLVDYRVTGLQAAFEAVVEEARRNGVAVQRSEIVGLVPQAALHGLTAESLRLPACDRSCTLEARIREVLE